MRLNRWNVPLSLIVGIVAIWAVYRAVDQYTAVTESITRVDVEYVDGSFVWLDPSFDQGEAEINITNRADRAVTVEYLELHLYFDGEFAGARYEKWDPITIPAGDQYAFTTTFTVTANSVQPKGGDATLSLRGYDTLVFEEFEEPFRIQVFELIGSVSKIET